VSAPVNVLEHFRRPYFDPDAVVYEPGSSMIVFEKWGRRLEVSGSNPETVQVLRGLLDQLRAPSVSAWEQVLEHSAASELAQVIRTLGDAGLFSEDDHLCDQEAELAQGAIRALVEEAEEWIRSWRAESRTWEKVAFALHERACEAVERRMERDGVDPLPAPGRVRLGSWGRSDDFFERVIGYQLRYWEHGSPMALAILVVALAGSVGNPKGMA
jgi:hypothetical protein